MKEIYLLKLYIKWIDDNTPKICWKQKAKVISAYKNKKDALEELKIKIEYAKEYNTEFIEKYFCIQKIKLI